MLKITYAKQPKVEDNKLNKQQQQMQKKLRQALYVLINNHKEHQMLDQTIFNQDNQIQSFDNAGNLIVNGIFDLAQNRVIINEFNICEDDNINNIKQFINVCKSKRIDQISFNVPNNTHEPEEQQEITDLLNQSGFTVSEDQGVIVGSIHL